MTALAILSEILNTTVKAKGIAGIAMTTPNDTQPQAVWVPASYAEEPAFLAYSLTKTYIAVLILRLHDQGQLTLDTPLAQLYPHIDCAQHITLRHLLNHTAGIPDYGGLPAYQDAVRTTPSTPWTFDRFA